jgi:hypothetical protein
MWHSTFFNSSLWVIGFWVGGPGTASRVAVVLRAQRDTRRILGR